MIIIGYVVYKIFQNFHETKYISVLLPICKENIEKNLVSVCKTDAMK